MSGKLYDDVAQLVVDATEGEVSREVLDAAEGKLYEAGVASLYLVAIIDNLEERYGVLLEPAEYVEVLKSVGAMVEYLGSQVCAAAS